MSIFGDIITAIKGGANEVGESIVDSQAIRIYEQEIREAEIAIEKAKKSLTTLKTTEIGLKRKLNTLNDDISDYETKAMQALDSGKEDLATEVAGRIDELEQERNSINEEHGNLKKEVSSIYSLIKKREKVIQKNKRELEKVKTVQQLQNATNSISANIAATGSSEHRVSKALDRIKKKQQRTTDSMEAGEWMEEQDSSSDLDKKLKDSGIGGENTGGADSVLERLKAKRNK
ncbi:MAG: PspA/IM30 family protein [Gammaproteobacteria bacterium]